MRKQIVIFEVSIMQYQITAPQTLTGTITLPASKSISNRALIISALGHNNQTPQNISVCDDTDVMVRALKEMPQTIDIGAAGTAMRFLTAYLAVTPGQHIITGTERMKHRPIGILVDALRTLGARISYVEQEGFPPLDIQGAPFEGGSIALPGNVSSQYISALLMIGPTMQRGLQLHLQGDIISRPYIDLTLKMMRDFGANARWTGAQEITVAPQPYRSTDYLIENDWSAASYWYQMVALSRDPQAEILLPGLFADSAQGDSHVAELFRTLGVGTEFRTLADGSTAVRLFKQGEPAARMEHDFINQPDLAQTFVVTCSLLGIPFHFKGLQSLKIKETDRITALIREMGKLGFVIGQANDSEMFWNGERCPKDEQSGIDTYEDHRMAMAFAPAALVLPEVRINNPHVVSKSYPQYWNTLQQAGFKITEACL